MRCVDDFAAGGSVCEYPCQITANCPNLATLCSGSVCSINQCGNATGNGVFDGLCNAVGTNDGTCMPLTLDAGLSSIGYCYQGGSSLGNCNPSATRSDLQRVCTPGFGCFGGSLTFGGTCNQLCAVNAGGTCPPGQVCSGIVNEPDLGICIQ